MSELICAVSTAPGVGGIAVVRISGEGAIAFVEPIFRAPQALRLASQKPNTVHYGHIVEGEEELDDVVVTLFHAPHSFTGEETVEIACHGSLYVQKALLKLLINRGCRLARAGEFTQRAFMNGKMDLSQAEAVADLIASTSASAHRMAMNQMRGGFSDALNVLRLQLLDFVSLIELELDFSEEEVEFADREKLRTLARSIETTISRLAESFQLGNVLKNGIPVALVGETNVGKSTLLNLLLGEERAIVSDIHGTTRDVIEDTVILGGVAFRFIDTAGIRHTDDTVENLGIERTYRAIEQASIILWLIDGTSVSEHIEWLTERILRRAEGKKVILVFNKIDMISDDEMSVLDTLFASYGCERVTISAKLRKNTKALYDALSAAAQLPDIGENDVVVSSARHYEALTKALASIRLVISGLDNQIDDVLLTRDIRDCMHYLGEITGAITNDEVLGNIFSKFCIGK